MILPVKSRDHLPINIENYNKQCSPRMTNVRNRPSLSYGGWRDLRFLCCFPTRVVSRKCDPAFHERFDNLTETEQDCVATIIIDTARHPETEKLEFTQYFPTSKECCIFPFAVRVAETLRTLSAHYNFTVKYNSAHYSIPAASLIVTFERQGVFNIPGDFDFYRSEIWEREELPLEEDVPPITIKRARLLPVA